MESLTKGQLSWCFTDDKMVESHQLHKSVGLDHFKDTFTICSLLYLSLDKCYAALPQQNKKNLLYKSKSFFPNTTLLVYRSLHQLICLLH